MSRKVLLLCFCLLAIVLPTAAPAATRMVGFDDMSCSIWKKSKDDREERRVYVAWVRGVLTGHNYARQSQPVAVVSNGTIENFIDQYCRETPQGDFGEAALRMSDRFSGRNEAISK